MARERSVRGGTLSKGLRVSEEHTLILKIDWEKPFGEEGRVLPLAKSPY